MRGKDILKMGEGERGEGRRGEPRYTFNCSFHGGVKDEEREGKISPEGEGSRSREGDSMQQVEGFLKKKFYHL